MKFLNKTMLIGNLGRDAETRYTTENLSITTFSIATTHNWKPKDGDWVNDTTWHDITCFNLNDYDKDILKKGNKIYVEGRITIKSYVDGQGENRKSFGIACEKLMLLNVPTIAPKEEIISASSEEVKLTIENNDDLPF